MVHIPAWALDRLVPPLRLKGNRLSRQHLVGSVGDLVHRVASRVEQHNLVAILIDRHLAVHEFTSSDLWRPGHVQSPRRERAAGAEQHLPWMWLERSTDFLFGAGVQIVFLLCVVWLLAGLMENTNAWIRQTTVVAVYLGINWLAQFL
jgi:hypothetical protein